MGIPRSDLEWGVKLLSDMISIPTVNPPGENFEKFSKYVTGVLKSIGMEVEVVEVPRSVVEDVCRECVEYPRYIVLGRAGSGKPVVQFNGHYDVVPPGSGWSSDPFSPRVLGDKLYGRGSVDMKGGIAAAMLAVKAFLSRYRDFRGTVEIALVPDEEIGGESGTGYLVKHVSKPDYAVIAEPSGLKAMWIGHKGAVWGFVEVFGKQAHGSTPWRGVNAFEYMAKIALRFVDEYRRVLDSRRSSYDYGDPEGARPTINIGGEVRGSVKTNVVPGYYAFSFDRRVVPEESVSDVEKELVELINKVSSEYPEIRVRVSITSRLTPALTDPNSIVVKALSKSVKGVLGFEPRLVVCLGGLDLHYYTEQSVEAVAYGPGPDANAHVVDEYVSLSEVEVVANVYTAMLESMLLPT
uniref:Probable succinyl-diaminopimelate desuccinylase n=1 Tax=Ignisphaera aggregans TaxID=334771 RepID=A0A7C4BD67_9CREN